MSLLVLNQKYDGKDRFNFDVNARSGIYATPLHFAVIFRELKNVELLVKLKADVNA